MFPCGAGMEIRLLGPVELIVDGRPVPIRSAKLRALLTMLAIHRGRVVSTDRLIDELWDERPPRTADGTLHAYVSRLRKTLSSASASSTMELLIRRKPGYQLAITPDQVDTFHFRTLVASARSMAEAGDQAEAVSLIEQARALWRGPALAEFADRSFARAEAAALEDLWLAAIEQKMECLLALGDHAALVGDLQPLTTEHPLQERLWGQLMLALYRSGRRGDAMLVFQRAKDHLREQLGIEPPDELSALADAIRHQQPGLDAHRAPGGARSEVAPLPLPAGLKPGITDSPFVGREGELVRLLEAWAEARRGKPGFVFLTGEPGIGKTRLVTEFALRASGEGATILWGRSSPA